MNQSAHPHPAQVPTLTEVIELLTPTPVNDAGMNNTPRPAAPESGTAAAAPIITGGLPASQQGQSWVPMTTVVVSSLDTVQNMAQRPLAVPPANLPVLQDAVAPVDVAAPAAPVPVAASAPEMPEISEAQLAQRVLSDVQKQIDGMLDFRLREAIGPVLARHSEALVKDLREELNRTMRDVVARSVAQEMAKLRQR